MSSQTTESLVGTFGKFLCHSLGKRCCLSFLFSIFTDRLQELNKKHYGVTTVMSEYIGVHVVLFCVFSLYDLTFPHHLLCGLTTSLSFLPVLQELLADRGHPTGIVCLRMFEDIAY